MNTKCTDIGSCFATDPENAQVSLIVELVQLAFVDGSDTELSLDGGDQRRTLEEGTSQGLESSRELCLTTWKFIVQSDNADILLSSTLLRLDKSCCAVNADDQASSNLGVEGTTVTSFLNSNLKLIWLVNSSIIGLSTSACASPMRRLRDWRGWRACRG